MSGGPAIVQKALLAGLATLIPIPFVDGAVKQAMQRSLVRGLAERRGLALSDRSIEALADDERAPLWRGVAMKVAMMPVKWLVRRALVVLSIKRAVDAISDVYHRAVLIDHAFERGYCAPEGKFSSVDVREAVDAVCREVRTGPVERAIAAGLDPYRAAMDRLATTFRGQLGRGGETAIDRASDEAMQDRDLLGAAASLWTELSQVPDEYFDELRRRLDARLGVD